MERCFACGSPDTIAARARHGQVSSAPGERLVGLKHVVSAQQLAALNGKPVCEACLLQQVEGGRRALKLGALALGGLGLFAALACGLSALAAGLGAWWWFR